MKLRGILSLKTPVVLAGSIDPDEQVGSVNIDYTAAAKDAVSLLAKNNQIAFVSGALIDPINGQTAKGYKEALKENNLEYSEGLIFESPYSFKEGLALVDRHQQWCDSSLCTDDELAIGVLDICRQRC